MSGVLDRSRLSGTLLTRCDRWGLFGVDILHVVGDPATIGTGQWPVRATAENDVMRAVHEPVLHDAAFDNLRTGDPPAVSRASDSERQPWVLRSTPTADEALRRPVRGATSGSRTSLAGLCRSWCAIPSNFRGLRANPVNRPGPEGGLIEPQVMLGWARRRARRPGSVTGGWRSPLPDRRRRGLGVGPTHGPCSTARVR